MTKSTLLTIFFLNSIIGNPAFADLKPLAQTIQQKHDLNLTFYPYDLFYNVHVLDENLHTALSSGVNADIIPGKLSSLVSQKPELMTLNIPFNGSTISIDLFRVNIFTDDFTVVTGNNSIVPYTPGIYYRGIIKGNPNSVAAFSFFNDQLYGTVSDDINGNIVVGKLMRQGNETEYVIYSERNLLKPTSNICHTAEEQSWPLKQEKQNLLRSSSNTNKCARFYYEIDHDLYQDNGSSTVTAANWITAVHNNIATLYFNDNITVSLSQVYVWSTSDPYNGSNSTDQLQSFRATRVSFNGDVGQLVARDNGYGGLAWLNTLCTSFNYSYADIDFAYSSVPTYSWTIEAMTHEFGHSLGSAHTHNCGWPIGALDDCYAPEGSCSPGPTPVNGGTIMSYCHLGSSGINFTNGFGPYPKDTIIYAVNGASCLGTSCAACPVPTHDLCSSPKVLSVTSNCVYLSGSFCGTTESIAPINCNGFTAAHGYDLWYKVIPTQTTLTINCQSGTSTDIVLAFYSGSCASPTLIQCEDATNTGGLETISAAVTSGSTYYIRVYDHNSNTIGTDFGICVSAPCIASSNNDCSSASTLTVGTSCTFTNGDLCSATQSMSPSTCSGYTAPNALDQWFKFVPTQSNVRLTCHAGTNTDVILGLYSGSCGNLNLVRCMDTTGAGGTETFTRALTIGNTYYVRVYDWEGNQYGTDYQLCVEYFCFNPLAPSSVSASSTNICTGSSTTLILTGSLSAGASWHWYSDSCGGTPVGTGVSVNVTPAATTTYYARAENGNCHSICQSVTITVTALPANPLSASAAPSSICAGNPSTLTVNGSLSAGAAWHWYSGACGGTAAGTGTSISVSPSSITTYYVRAENGSCYSACTATSVIIIAPPNDPVSINSSSSSICIGDTVNLNVTGSLSAGSSWHWYKVSCGGIAEGTGVSIVETPSSNTTYFVRAENGNCFSNCLNTSVNVSQSAGVILSITALVTTLCPGDSAALIVNGSLGTGSSWHWYTDSCGGPSAGTGISIIVPAANETYYVRAENASCYTSCLNASISLNNPPASPSINIAGNILSVPVFQAYQWYWSAAGISFDTAGTAQQITASTTGYYFTVVTDANGCTVSSDTIFYLDNAVVENNINEYFSVYPNPAKDVLYILVKNKSNEKIIAKIYDNIGRLVYFDQLHEGKTNNISFSEFAKGIYQLMIAADGNIFSQKVLKE